MPSPVVRETSSGSIGEANTAGRRKLIGLPPRFDNKG